MQKFVSDSAFNTLAAPSPSPPLSDFGNDETATSVTALRSHHENIHTLGRLASLRHREEHSTEADNGRSMALVTPPPSIGDVSEQAAMSLKHPDSSKELGTIQESCYFDEDDFEVVVEESRDEGSGVVVDRAQLSISSVTQNGEAKEETSKNNAVVLVSPPTLSERKNSSPPRKLGAKEITRRQSKTIAVATNSRRRSVGTNGTVNNRALTALSVSSRRHSVDSCDEAISASAAGYYLMGEERLLPRQSLRRDVKNDKRISYTTTKITGDLNNSSGGSSNNSSSSGKTAATAAQQPRRSAVSLFSPQISQRLVSDGLQQNGGISDCSTQSDSSSERRFSERRFTGRAKCTSFICVGFF